MGCGETLAYVPRSEGPGYVTCVAPSCPNHHAAHKILADSETEHIVQLDDDGVSVQHPLRERLDGDLFVCGLFTWLGRQPVAPYPLGRYRVRSAAVDAYSQSAGASPWEFERIDV